MKEKIKNKILGLVLFVLSLLLTLHFAFTFVIWSMYIRAVYSKNVLNWFEWLNPIIAVVLFSISLATFILVILKKRIAVFLIALTIILSTCCFIYETRYSKSSYMVCPIIVNGEEPYQGIGYRYSFINWIWYEKDVIRSGDFTKDKVFHHFFGIRPKGYISSSTLTHVSNQEKIEK